MLQNPDIQLGVTKIDRCVTLIEEDFDLAVVAALLQVARPSPFEVVHQQSRSSALGR